MALREELDNYNAEIVIGPEDDPQVTNAQLAVEEWNRTTVADGAWLQQNAIGPLSARDIVLANAIDDTNDALSALSAQVSGLDGRSLKSVNGRFFSGGEAWEGSKDAVVPDGTFIKNGETVYIPKNDEVILSMNDDGGHAFQLQLKPNEIGYRRLAGSNTAEADGDYPGTKYKYDTQAGNFIPLLKKSDLPQEDVWFGIKNGDFAPLDYPSADNVSIGVNEDNQLYVKHLSNPMWVKTSDGAIDGSAMDEDNETYLHGHSITTVSAIRSTIIGYGSKLHNVEHSNLVVAGTSAGEDSKIDSTFGYFGGCSLGPSAQITRSVIFGGGLHVSAGNRVAYSLILENATFEGSGTDPYKEHEGIINLDGSNRFINADDAYNNNVTVAGGGNQICACRQLGIFGNNNKMDHSDNTVFAGGGADISGTSYTFLLGTGGTYQKNLDNSFVACGGSPGNYLSNISTSIVNLAAPYVDRVQHSLLLGISPTFSGYSDESPLNYCIIDGLYTSACYGAPIYTVALGNGNEISRANRSLILGEYTQTKGRNCINNGYANSAYGHYAILQGRENTMGNFDYGMAIGEENKLWYNYQVAVGSGNMLVNNNFQVAIGIGNIGEQRNTLTIGNYNINGSYDSLLVGDNISAWGAGHAFVLGSDNKVTDENVAVIGNGLHTSRGNQVQIGKFNVGYRDSILEISWGDNDSNRKTMFRVTTAGDVYVAGTLHTEVGPMIGG